MSKIERISALEILDSRGRPTVKATCALAGEFTASASVPSGASRGRNEAVELRDGDASRHAGLGCLKAVTHVNRDLNRVLAGRTFSDQESLDRTLIELDGTPDKSRLGANGILSVSLAFARAQAAERGIPLYRHLVDPEGPSPRLPRPTVNLFSGGKHAGGQVSVQDLLIVPLSAASVDQALVTAAAVYRAASELCSRRYGMRLLTADEGGLAPPFPDLDTMFEDALRSVEQAGFRPGEDVALAVDVASSHFFDDGRYRLHEEPLTAEEMVETISHWVSRYPIVSIEDGLDEDAWEDWPLLRRRLSGRALTLGDDLLCTQPARIRRAVEREAADALLLKVNQVGTLSEARSALRIAREAGWRIVASARSGETEDDWLADLAVGWAADGIKVGSVTQSERLAKYNRLLEIEAAEGLEMAPLVPSAG